jgi:predicted transcriptional regulator
MNSKQKLLRDVMTRGVTSVPMDTPIREVADVMARQNVSGVAVTDHNGEIMGIISEMDILKVVLDESLLDSSAETIMNPFVQSVKPSSTLDSAVQIMMNKGIHRLIVLSESGVGASNRPVGILCASDVVKELSKT